MNIKPGKWRMRNGECAVVEFRTQSNTKAPWIGYDMDTKGLMSWHESGAYYSHEQYRLDLIEPWTDKPVVDWSAMPAWAKWVAQDSNGGWYWYTSKPVLSPIITSLEGSWVNQKGKYETGCVFDTFIPSFDGDWRDSLVKRPSA